MAGGEDIVRDGKLRDRSGKVWQIWTQKATCEPKEELEKRIGRPLRCVATSNGRIGAWYV